MKVLVTGGREYKNYHILSMALDKINPTFIISGGAKGADSLAERWAKENGVHIAIVPALWDFYKLSAGVLRNKAMLELSPDLCLAFPGGKGTRNMVGLCTEVDIKIQMVTE